MSMKQSIEGLQELAIEELERVAGGIVPSWDNRIIDQLRGYRPPEPYRGQPIRYTPEPLVMRSGPRNWTHDEL